MDGPYRSDHSARVIIPVKRKYDQRYVMYTSESSQMDIIPPLINQAHLSRQNKENPGPASSRHHEKPNLNRCDQYDFANMPHVRVGLPVKIHTPGSTSRSTGVHLGVTFKGTNISSVSGQSTKQHSAKPPWTSGFASFSGVKKALNSSKSQILQI